MQNKKPSILITLDSMKDPNTGFYYFGKALFESISKQNAGMFDISFYVKDKTGFFDRSLSLYHNHKYHKLFFPFFYRFDLTHITDQFCRLRPDRVMGKKVLTIHDLNQLHQPDITERAKQNSIRTLRKHIKNSDRVVAISNFVANDIRANFPESAAKVSVIYNGADKLTLTDGHTPPHIPKKPFLFALGPLNAKKNFHVLPALLQHNDLELVLSGITPTPAYTELVYAQAREFGCEDRLIITGPISEDDKAWYYKNCSAFLFPSLAEGFGLPVIEAMSFGKPVFLSDKTSLPEVGGNEAFYFRNFDAVHMQTVFNEGMAKYTNDKMEATLKARAALFTWENTSSDYINLYRQLLA